MNSPEVNYTKKRKRVVVTVKEKLGALERIDNGETIVSIANDLGVSENTVRDWKKNRTQLQSFYSQVDSSLLTRCTLKKPKHDHIDEALWLWFVEEQKKGKLVTGPMLKEKALILEAKTTNKGDFTASNGWLSRWKKRHGVYQKEGGKDMTEHSPLELVSPKSESDNLNKYLTERCLQLALSPENAFECRNGPSKICTDERKEIKIEATDTSFSDVEYINVLHAEDQCASDAQVKCFSEAQENRCKEKNTSGNSRDETIISDIMAKEAFSTALKYVKQQPEASLIDILLIKKWLDFTTKQLYPSQIETNIKEE